MKTRLALLLLLVLPLKLAYAVTYYVDSATGNNAWTGRQAAPVGSPATDGPWLTLTKVSAVSLLPGDTVLLKCGGTWQK